MRSDPALLALAESVADGSAINWNAAESSLQGRDQSIVRQLRILAELAAVHRTLPLEPQSVALTPSRRTASAPAIGRWAHLDLIERLGGGSFGEVYRAWDRHLEREVALKLLRIAEASPSELGSSRIVTEGRLLARVHHPNVVTVYGVAGHDGRVGLWMELVDGATLEHVLLKTGPMSAREAAIIGIDLCRALAALHAAGLIHRDIKTQNVMRQSGGRIVLMDFGTGRPIDRDQPHALADLAGTPLYLAPELFEGAVASERTDLYSLGVLLYRLVTGSFPVRAAAVEALHKAHAAGHVTRLRDLRPDLPSTFVRVIDRAVASDPGRRYRSAGELEADLTASIGGARPHPPFARHRMRMALAMAAAIVVTLSLGVMRWRSVHTAESSAVRPVASGPIRSIAVLPLANLAGDGAPQYFADGLTDELIATLGGIRQLNVISRTTITQINRSGRLLPDLARTLGVEAVLEGSVFIAPALNGDPSARTHVRINARLIHAGSDTQLWDRTFDRVFTDILALQRDVATAVADELNVRLMPDERGVFGASDTRNEEAERLYLEARANLTGVAPGRLSRARNALERALQLDPNYARARSALAVCAIYMQGAGMLSRSDAHALVVREAKRAIQLDPNLPEAHAVLADAQLFYEWDWSGAESGYRRALAINPSYSWARARYAEYLEATGRTADALVEARRGQQADPLSADAAVAVAMAMYYGRRYDDAIQQFETAAGLNPSAPQAHIGLARAYAAEGAFDDAVREINKAIELSGSTVPVFQAELARTLAAAGEGAGARRLLDTLERSSGARQRGVPPDVLATVYVALGRSDRAMPLLERGLAEHTTGLLFARVDPRVDALRTSPRFKTLLQRIGPAS